MRKRKILTTIVAAMAFLSGFAQVDSLKTPVPEAAPFGVANPPEMRVSELAFTPGFASDTLPDYSKKRKVLRHIGYPVVAAGSLVASYYFLDHDLRHDVPNDESKFKDFISEWAEPLGRSATMYPGYGALMAYGLVAKDPKARKAAAIGIAAYFVNEGVTTQLKKGFNRMRPSSGAGYNEWFSGEPHRSFPSSHTSTAFAAATVLASVYHDKKLVAPIAYGVASVVGFSRLYHNQHWASDVVAGAIVGIVTAKATYYSYNFLEKKWKNRRQNLVLVPQVSPTGFSATAVVTF